MPKKHRQWTTLIGYFKTIPFDETFITCVKTLLQSNINILIMIKKEDYELNPKHTMKEKFEEICKLFPKETKTGKIIISAVPDITDIVEWNF